MMTTIRTISHGELTQRLGQGPIPQFWNVLTDDYFQGELIPGSRRVPLDRVAREALQTHLPQDGEIVVYCSGPTCPQSRAAAEKLVALGYTNVRAFEGGLEHWKAAGGRIENAAAAATAAR